MNEKETKKKTKKYKSRIFDPLKLHEPQNRAISIQNASFDFIYSDGAVSALKYLLTFLSGLFFLLALSTSLGIPIHAQIVVNSAVKTTIIYLILTSLFSLFSVNPNFFAFYAQFAISAFGMAFWNARENILKVQYAVSFFLIRTSENEYGFLDSSSFSRTQLDFLCDRFFAGKTIPADYVVFLENLQSGVLILGCFFLLIFLSSAAIKNTILNFFGAVILFLLCIPSGAAMFNRYSVLYIVCSLAIFAGRRGGNYIARETDDFYLKLSFRKIFAGVSSVGNEKNIALKRIQTLLVTPRPAPVSAISGVVFALVAAFTVHIIFPPEDKLYFSDEIKKTKIYSVFNKAMLGLQEKYPWLPEIGQKDESWFDIQSSGAMNPNNMEDNYDVIRVTAGENVNKIYLRSQIYTGFNSETFKFSSETEYAEDFERLHMLGFDPEYEKYVASLFANIIFRGFGYPDPFSEVIVGAEYYAGTSKVFLPSTVFVSEFDKTFTADENSKFKYNLDTIVSVKGDIKPGDKFNFSAFIPIDDEYQMMTLTSFAEDEIAGVSEYNNQLQIYCDGKTITGNNFPNLKTFTGNIDEYRRLVYEVYTKTSPYEVSNMQRLYEDILEQYPWFDNMTSYEKAVLAEKYLKYNYKYSLNAKNNLDGNTILGNFLFETRKGWCIFYAASMAEFMRSQGVPARVVSGFTASNLLRQPDGTYAKTISSDKAHAWVEVYFENVGWLPFDPTGSDDSQNEAEETVTTAVTTERATSDITTKKPTTSPISTNDQQSKTSETPKGVQTDENGEVIKGEVPPELLPIIIISIIIFALLIILIMQPFLIIHRREKNVYLAFRILENAEDSDKSDAYIIAVYSLLLRTLRYKGYVRKNPELFKDFGERAGESEIFVNLPEIIGIIEKIEYSKTPLSADEKKVFAEFVRTVYGKCLSSSKIEIAAKLKILLRGNKKFF